MIQIRVGLRPGFSLKFLPKSNFLLFPTPESERARTKTFRRRFKTCETKRNQCTKEKNASTESHERGESFKRAGSKTCNEIPPSFIFDFETQKLMTRQEIIVPEQNLRFAKICCYS